MLALVFSRRTIRLSWFWLCVEFLCLLGTSGHMCYPHCTCEGESMDCHWPDRVSMNVKNGTETIFIHDLKNVTCDKMTSTQPIDIHFVGSNIDFIPSCMFGNVTIVNLLFTESKIRVIRCLEFLGKSIETLIFHKSEISSIQSYAFSGSKIKNLLITQSTITQIEKHAFYHSSLKAAVFVEDAIHYMSSGLFPSDINSIMSNFILYQCDIFYIGCQRNLPTAFTLNKNKMTCNAQLHWLLKLLQGNKKMSGNKCHRPEMMRGRPLADLDMTDICWPPDTCNGCPSVEVEPNKVKCLHISGNPIRRLLKKSPNIERKLPSPIRKKIRGLKHKMKHAISNRNKTGRQGQRNSRLSTVAPSITLSAPDITERKDLYLNFNFDSVGLNHTDLKGKNRKLNIGGKNESSVLNRTSDLNIKGPENHTDFKGKNRKLNIGGKNESSVLNRTSDLNIQGSENHTDFKGKNRKLNIGGKNESSVLNRTSDLNSQGSENHTDLKGENRKLNLDGKNESSVLNRTSDLNIQGSENHTDLKGKNRKLNIGGKNESSVLNRTSDLNSQGSENHTDLKGENRKLNLDGKNESSVLNRTSDLNIQGSENHTDLKGKNRKLNIGGKNESSVLNRTSDLNIQGSENHTDLKGKYRKLNIGGKNESSVLNRTSDLNIQSPENHTDLKGKNRKLNIGGKNESSVLNRTSDLNIQSPENHTDLEGKNRKLNLDGKNESSVLNRTSDFVNNIQGPEKDNSTMLAPSNNLKKKTNAETKFKNLKSREARYFPGFTPQIFKLNNNSMIPRKEKGTLFVSNDTVNNSVPNEKESQPKILQESNLKDPLSPPARENLPQGQNLSESNQTAYGLWKKIWETPEKGLQDDDDDYVSNDLLIQTMTKQVQRITLTNARKGEKEKRRVFVEKIDWARNVVPVNEMKMEKPVQNKTKRKKRNLGLFKQLMNYPRAKEDADVQKIKETSTKVITRGYESVLSVKQKVVAT